MLMIRFREILHEQTSRRDSDFHNAIEQKSEEYEKIFDKKGRLIHPDDRVSFVVSTSSGWHKRTIKISGIVELGRAFVIVGGENFLELVVRDDEGETYNIPGRAKILKEIE